MLNTVSIMGRLTADPELRITPNGTAVTSFSIACERDKKTENGEREVDFFDIVAWRNTAEFVNRYFSKGRMAAISGRLQTRNWTDKDGNKRKFVEVVADNIYFGDSKKNNTGEELPVTTPKAAYPTPQPPAQTQQEPSCIQTGFDGFSEISSDDDLPF